MALVVEVAGKSDVGCVRTNNEDNFGYDLRYGIFVVCDGMGGQAAGEVASKIAVDTILDSFRAPWRANTLPVVNNEPPLSSAGQTLTQAVRCANRAVYDTGQERSTAGMGSTMVAALIRANALSIGNVGDSRIYLIRQGSIEQLTHDHSWVMEQVRLGLLTREEAAQSTMQNVILRALGSEEDVKVDVEDLVVLAGDVLLLTSDGLTRHVSDDEILQIVSAAGSPAAAAEKLIQTARDRGGSDNITCLLLRIVEQPWYKHIGRQLFSGGSRWQNSI
ncbi:MAG TPA: Stp1/IreP family PP2C-type Ser/Thr phosphatase [Alphaproteobacteria bacterium]|nr:Stp1/IreP family PP2C-type Ser/Thr phosphatase [Alphaproteobacteria bacterium]